MLIHLDSETMKLVIGLSNSCSELGTSLLASITIGTEFLECSGAVSSGFLKCSES